MIITGALILDEMPNLWGIIGIFTTCLGGYVLNLDPARPSLWAPFKAVFRETGSWLMLIVAFIFSFAAVVGKQGILHSSVFYTEPLSLRNKTSVSDLWGQRSCSAGLF
jgi:hypothetical protein